MKTEIDDLGVVGILVEDWDISKSFKPKTITTDYSTWITYISRRAVPANTEITDTYYWKPIYRLETAIAADYNAFKELLLTKFNELDKKFNTFIGSTSNYALDDKLGNSEIYGINQKVITNAFNKIWEKFEDITGEVLQGISMTVSPNYYIGDSRVVEIHAKTVDTNGIFEKIAFYKDNVLIEELENVDRADIITTLEKNSTKTNVIKCIAQIMGVTYTRTVVVRAYDQLWIGAGDTYTEVMNLAHNVDLTDNMRLSTNVEVEDARDGEHIIIVMGAELRSEFIRADLNGVEIAFTEAPITVDNKEYVVFTSVNLFNAGTYNIDING